MPAHRLVIALDADTHVAGGPRRHREEPHSQTDTALNSEKFGTVPRCVAQAAVAARGVAAPLPPHRTPAGSPAAGALYRRHPRLRMPLTIWRAAPAHRPPSGGHFLGGGRCRGRECDHWLTVLRLGVRAGRGVRRSLHGQGVHLVLGRRAAAGLLHDLQLAHLPAGGAAPGDALAHVRRGARRRPGAPRVACLAWRRAPHGSRPHLRWGPSHS